METKSLFHPPAYARWHRHINAIQATTMMQEWLRNRESLTARLVARCEHFRVQRLCQGRSNSLQDEFKKIGLSRSQKVMSREVLLRCDEVPVVYAHTVLPLHATTSQWPSFATLGNKSLGSTLFSDPQVQRGALNFARLHLTHPLFQRIEKLGLINEKVTCLYARRSVFERMNAKLLVTEVFLPSVLHL